MVVIALIRSVESQFLWLRFSVRAKRESVKRTAGIRQQILAIRRPIRRLPKFVRRINDANALAFQIIDRDLAAATLLGLGSAAAFCGEGACDSALEWRIKIASANAKLIDVEEFQFHLEATDTA